MRSFQQHHQQLAFQRLLRLHENAGCRAVQHEKGESQKEMQFEAFMNSMVWFLAALLGLSTDFFSRKSLTICSIIYLERRELRTRLTITASCNPVHNTQTRSSQPVNEKWILWEECSIKMWPIFLAFNQRHMWLGDRLPLAAATKYLAILTTRHSAVQRPSPPNTF